MAEMSITNDPYANIAEFYDLEHQAFDDDVEFYGSFIESVGDPVLELGSGTGRLLLPIAQAGFRVTGLDQSQAMLDRASALLSSHQLTDKAQLVQGSMTHAEAAPGGPFGVAILALNGLLHLETQRDQRACIASTLKCLDPRGLLLIDILNPTPDTLRGLDHSLSHQGTWRRPDGSHVDRFTSTKVNIASQRIDTDLWYDITEPDRTLRRVRTSFVMRYLHLAELELLLELAGFREWQIYGSYELDALTDHSERIIVAAEATRSN